MNAKVVFAEEKLKKALEKLKDSKTEDRQLYEWLDRAFGDLQSNPFCGISLYQETISENTT